MLFSARFKEGIRDGKITVTFRAWRRPQVKPGSVYSCPPVGVIQIKSLDQVALHTIDDGSARASGFASVAELREELRRTATRQLTHRSKIYRIRFHYQGEAKPAPEPDSSKATLDDLAARLERMDRLSRRGPWTRRVLHLIDRRPRVAAARLAPALNRETQAFKADVRKLKGLGLTESLETGYRLSKLGRAFLKHLQRN